MPELLEKEREYPVYAPSDDAQKIIARVWQKWSDANEQRQGNYRFFNDRSLIDYVNDSVDRFNGYIPPREDPARDWGAHVFNNITRQKCIAINAQVTAERVKEEIFPQNHDQEDDVLASEIIKKLSDHAYYKNKDDEEQFYGVLE